MNLKNFLNKTVTVVIDRPKGSNHPKHGWEYPLNYGYIPNTISGDGKEIDAYILGIDKPLKNFVGTCIAIIHRLNDNEDKLILSPKGMDFSDEEILSSVNFQERYFESRIIR